ncbi:MAG: hypothetical protein KH268_09100 [Clostridiales bacterium]|nr:hypothetical protein [Clostridiales bacterium]
MYQEYENRRKQYDGRQGQSARRRVPEWRREYGLPGERQRFSEEEDLPYGVGFRIRLVLCAALFFCFAFAQKNLWTEEEREVVYEAMAADTIKIPEIKYIFFK